MVETLEPAFDAAKGAGRLSGRLSAMGDARSLQVGFEYRDITGLDLTERHDSWQASPLETRSIPGAFMVELPGLRSGHAYEVRAVVRHPLLMLYGAEVRLQVP
jgi:alpha-L-fucosidase